MTRSDRNDSSTSPDATFPRRDWIVLPALGLLTICFVFLVTELAARRMFPVSKTLMASCLVLNDPSTGTRAIPNSVCWEKSPESVGEEYRFNSCGHRAGMECGPKPQGTYRIVMLGSSIALGERVRREDSFAALLPMELSRLSGHKVELYNEAMGWSFAGSTALRFDNALNAQPDLILWPLTVNDIQGSTFTPFVPEKIGFSRSMTLREKAWLRIKAAFSSRSVLTSLSDVFSHTRTAVLVRHYMYESQSQYVNAALKSRDGDFGFLKTEPGEKWKVQLQQFEGVAAGMERRAKAANIPFVATYVPIRAQAAMISMGNWPAGFDPYLIDNELRSIIERHGGIYISILHDYRSVPNPEQTYYPVDGHPNAAGHALIARLLAKELTSGAVPALKAPERAQAELERGK